MRKVTFRTALAIFCVGLMAGGMSPVKAQTGGQGKFQIFAPNTYSLGMYGDVPVDYSTGVPQINVPLLNFTDKDINLDISLSYHASGIKVDQEATWVGLGWALNAGGMITREVRGLPDGGNNYGRTSIPDYHYGGSMSQETYYSQVSEALYEASSNITDNGADIFYYNFNGRAGKFFLDESGNAVFTKYEDLKVQVGWIPNPGYSTNPNFVITDERGLKYEFEANETTSTISGGMSYISAWYLTKISSPSGGEITLEYVPGGISSSYYQKRCYSQAYFAIDAQHGYHALPPQYTTPCIDHDTDIGGIVPKKITNSAGNYIEFVTSPNLRLDSDPTLMAASNQLDYIVLRNSSGEQIKKFGFNYSYFEANDGHKFPAVGSNDLRNFLNYRLRLDSYQEISSEGLLQSPYRFEYYGDDNPLTDDPYTLPYRLSPSQDHWGYYNGSYNQTIFPMNPANKRFHMDDWFFEFLPGEGSESSIPYMTSYSVINGGIREPDGEAVKAGALSKIIYPTGGYSRFDFEAHGFSGGLRIKQLETQGGTGSPIIKNYEYDAYNTFTNEKCLTCDNPYYTVFYHFRDPQHPDSYPGIPGVLVAFGVPADLAYNNSLILRAEGTSQIMLGSGMNAVYRRVTELSPGNGATVYNYSLGEDIMDISGDQEYDGVAFNGLFNSAYVLGDTYAYYLFSEIYNPKGISSCTFPFPNFLNNDWRRGHLMSKEVYSQDNVLLSESSIEYDIRAIKAVPGYKAVEEADGRYFYARYYDVGGIVKPVRELNKTYNNDGSYLQTVKELDYTSTAHKQLTESREFTSIGDMIRTKYYYPPEYGNVLSSLKDRNILAPVDTRSYRNGKLISGSQVQYNEKGLPMIVYRSEAGGNDIAFNAQAPFTFTPKLWNGYNQANTLQTQAGSDGSKAVFLWSYKNQYPVAQILNADYEDIKNALNDPGETFLQALRGKETPSVEDEARLNALRSSTAMRRALITTYTYRPLVGMTSMRDPNGRNTYYEYDAFNRLEFIRDHDHNILKRICYNYAGQPDPDCKTGYFSATQSRQVTKNNCAPHFHGSTVNFTVPASSFFSTVSQAAADQLALDYLNTHGQEYANEHGVCISNCAPESCAGEAYKCINGECEYGIQVATECTYDTLSGTWEITYHYEWSDGSWSENYTIYNADSSWCG